MQHVMRPVKIKIIAIKAVNRIAMMINMAEMLSQFHTAGCDIVYPCAANIIIRSSNQLLLYLIIITLCIWYPLTAHY